MKISLPTSWKKLLPSLIFSMVIGIISSVFFVLAQPSIPLFYSLALSNSQLTSKIYVFLLPGISLFINIVHATILQHVRRYDQIIQTLFVWSTLIIQTLLLLALVRIMVITL